MLEKSEKLISVQCLIRLSRVDFFSIITGRPWTFIRHHRVDSDPGQGWSSLGDGFVCQRPMLLTYEKGSCILTVDKTESAIISSNFFSLHEMFKNK